MEISVFDEKIKQLSPEEQKEVMRHIDDILSSKKEEAGYQPSFNWAGGLSFLRSKFTSLELQKKSNEWLAGNI